MDDSKSLDSDGSVDDGFSPLDGDEGISVSRSTPSRRHSRQLPGQIGSLNVREMASFLEKTDSFIRRIDSGGESTQSRSKVANEVPSRPFKSRQAFDLGSWSSGYSVDQYTHGDDMVLRMEQSVELQRENFRLRDRLLEMQGRLERSEKEVLRLRDVIKQLKHGSSVDLSDSEEGSSTVLSPQQFVYSPFGLDEMVTVSGVGSEFINAIGFATAECTPEVELYSVEERETLVNVAAKNLDYHVCVSYTTAPALIFVSSVTFKVVGVDSYSLPVWIAGLPLPTTIHRNGVEQVMVSGVGLSSSDRVMLTTGNCSDAQYTMRQAVYEGAGAERVSFNDAMTFEVEEPVEFSVCYFFNILNTVFPTTQTMTVYPNTFPVTLTPPNPVILGAAETATLAVALQPFAQVTKNDKVFIGGADCVYAEQTLVDAEEQMSFSVSALVGRQSVCYVYGGDVTLATQLATFFVSKYSGLSTTKFAAGVSTRAVIRIVNAATGDEVAIANANGEIVATFPVTVDGEASFVFRYDVAGEYSVFYKYAHSEASFATLETVTVAAVQSVS